MLGGGCQSSSWDEWSKSFLVMIWLTLTLITPLNLVFIFFLFFIMFNVSWSQFYFLTLFLYFTYYNFRLLYLKKKLKFSQVWCVQLHYMLFISGLLLKAIFVYEKGGQSDAAMKGLLLNVKIDYFKGKCYTLSRFYT